MKGSFLGPRFDEDEIESELKSLNANFKKLPEQDLLKNVVDGLVKGKAIGWMQVGWNLALEINNENDGLLVDPRRKRYAKTIKSKNKNTERVPLRPVY